MNALILEDERSSANRLAKLISNHREGKNIHLYFAERISEAVELFTQKKIDLLFLDLKLNSEDGFDILKSLVSKSFYTVIVSAFTERAIEAYEYGVLDFIPKPIFQERVNQTLDRIFVDARFASTTKVLIVRNRNRLETVKVERIVYLQPAGHYTEIILDTGQKKLHTLSLDKIIKILPKNFERTHRSYITNIEFISKIITYTGSKYEIELTNNTTLPLGRKYVKNIKLLFTKKL